jgi:hypothetical protein
VRHPEEGDVQASSRFNVKRTSGSERAMHASVATPTLAAGT